MDKTYYEACNEGRCANCDREHDLCKEENKCLKPNTIYTITIHFRGQYISTDFKNKEAFEKLCNELDTCMENGNLIKINNFTVNAGKIDFYKTEVFYE